jgi:hypothetical protein
MEANGKNAGFNEDYFRVFAQITYFIDANNHLC